MNTKTLIAQLINLVGWKQNPDPTSTNLIIDLTTTEFGVYFNGAHPLLTYDNLRAVITDDSAIVFPTYSAGTEYQKLDKVQDGGGVKYIYINETATTGTALATTTHWRKYDRMTEELRAITEQGIINACQRWLNTKVINNTGKQLLKDNRLIQSTGDHTDTTTKTTLKRGIEFIIPRSKSLVTEPYQVGVQFSTDGNITVQVFESGTMSPIETKVIAYTGSGGVQWETLTTQFKGGYKYWVIYDEADGANTVGDSINGCADVGYIERDHYYISNNRYFSATAFTTTESITTLWDIKNNNYTQANNWGLNFKLRTKCDYTQFIIDNRQTFQSAIVLSVGMLAMELLATNPDALTSANISNISQAYIQHQIKGFSEGNSKMDRSLAKRYEEAVEGIQLDNAQIDKVCLPCKQRGIRFKT